MRTSLLCCLAIVLVPWPVAAADPAPGEALLQLDAQGPTARVTSLAFSRDGLTLHAAGYDKVIRTWTFDGKQFVRRERLTYRIPIGPGAQGNLNALAVSNDEGGRWIATAGVGLVRESAGFREPGIVLPAIGRVDDQMRQDLGSVFVFVREEPEKVTILRGHRGPVLALAFAQGEQSDVLASYALEWDGSKEVGVVRLWDVARGKELENVKPRVLPVPGRGALRPGLAVWNTGKQASDTMVAIANADGKLRVWDVANDTLHDDSADGPGNDTVIHLGNGRLLTGSYRNQNGYLAGWTVASGRKPAIDRELGGAVGQGLWPRALALASSEEKGKADVIAQVLRQPATEEADEVYRLRLGSLDGRSRAEIELWKGGRIHPTIAAAPGGRFLAVAGNLTHDIHLYDISDLLNKKARPFHQEVRSLGQWWQYVAFVKQGAKLGLALSARPGSRTAPGATPREPVRGDLIFDFSTNRVLSENVDRWNLDAPEPPEGIRPRPMTGDQRLSTWAYLPRGKHGVPLLAQAFQERGQTYLFLYNQQTGEPLRLYTGHLNAVTALAFSRDGRLLVSVAEDQTVNVWSLKDLDGLIGGQGAVRGLVIRGDEGKLTVAALENDTLSAANKKALADAGIKVDDRLTALVVGGKEQPLKDVRDYYQAVWMTRPGARVTLSFGAKDVTLTVDQGIDERKPLFTLFLTRQGEWVGWNPAGPYDRSDADTETLIGWHSNTGQAKTPVTFASADRYRKEFLRPGLLERLVARAELGAALQDLRRKELPEPVVKLELREAGQAPVRRDARGNPIVQKRPLELVVSIFNISAEQLSWVRWRIDNGPWKDFAQVNGTEYRHDLSGEAWQRGLRTIQVALRPADVDGAEQSHPLQVLYLPPPPKIRFDADWEKLFGEARQAAVRKKEFEVRADVEGVGGEAVEVSLWRGKGLVKEIKDGKFRGTVELKEGRNEFVLRAGNARALEGHVRDELSEYVFTVDYSPVAVPKLVVASVAPSADGGTMPREGLPVTVYQREVRIRGVVEAETRLTDVTLDGKSLPEFTSGQSEKFTIDITRALRPGEQTLVFKAQAKDSPAREFRLKLDLVPELPEFVLRKPANLHWLPPETREIVLEGALAPLEDYPYQVELTSGEQKVETTLDKAAGTLRSKVPLKPGVNTLDLVVKLDDRSRATRLRAYVRRPPSLRLQAPAAAPLVTLSATVETPADLDLTSGRLTGTLAERPIDLAKEVRKGEAADGVRRWTVELKDVPLTEEVDNVLTLRVSNPDGEVQQSITVRGPKRKLPPATVTITDPRVDEKVDAEKYRLKFTVQSESRLSRLAVLRDGESVAELPVRELATGQEVDVALKAGPNVIEVIAVNEAGEARSVKRTISRRADTVFLHIDRVVGRATGKEVKFTRKGDTLVLDEVESGELVLHGHVRWLDRRSELAQPQLVRLYVNGFEQFPAGLESAEGRLERPFRVAFRLNQEKNNTVVLDLPGLKVDQTTPGEFKVERCLKPEKEQRLHLLIVGVGLDEAAQERLLAKVLDVFQARNVKPGKARGLVQRVFQTPVFKEGRVYGPMTGDTTKQEVYTMLEHISDTVQAERGDMNEVLVVYFQGQRVVTADEYYLLTQQSRLLKNYDRAALTRDGLRQAVGKTLGAQLLLLDVTQMEKGSPPAPTDFQRIGMFEYTWLRNNPPENGRLIDSLKDSMSQARLLNEVEAQVKRRADVLREKDKDFRYDVRVSELLGQMSVGSGN